MASLRALGQDVPFTMPLSDDGRVTVLEQLLCLKFLFRKDTIYIEEEVFDSSGVLLETILQLKLGNDEGAL